MKRQHIISCGLSLALSCLGASQAWAKPKVRKVAPVPVSPVPAADSGNEPGSEEPPPSEPEAPPTAAVTTPPAAVEKVAASKVTEPAAQEQLATLRSDVATLIDDMVEARARAALLGKTLFKTRLALKVQNLAAPDPVLANVVLKLDGAPVFRGDGSALVGDTVRQVFEGFIAPGPHVLLVELEQRSQRDATYGYTLHDSYRFQALREKQSELTLIIDDDSDLASEFPDEGSGEYDLHVKLRVRTKAAGEE